MNLTKQHLNEYLDAFVGHLRDIKATDHKSVDIDLADGIKQGLNLIINGHKNGGTLTFIGNGGSAAIASHQATDFIRTCGIRAYAPLDHSLLTCMGNDVGYENVFATPLDVLSKKEDVLIAISSSGKSKNILNAVLKMKSKGSPVITLSGFKPDNDLRKLGDVNFYVPSDSYRHVESAHLFICNWILDFTQKSMNA